ncbi:unnamed protein product [Heligmosomoides polygyrus]|uniref:Dynein light chain n=1 Tax=Heligmosomoides polygyrus TaxID=6339 RepID=A0A183GNQ3_HELPZ|nr:unnamed protein product [Heligmosomoides polygyrus]
MADSKDGSHFNEEDLLRSSGSDNSEDEMEHDGRMPDKGVEKLRKQVETLGHKDTSQSLHDGEVNTVLAGKVDIDAISPRVLKAYAEQRLRQESRNAIAAGHRFGTFVGRIQWDGCPFTEESFVAAVLSFGWGSPS